jgi:hypothetical protein
MNVHNGAKTNVWIIKEFSPKFFHNVTWSSLVSPSGTITSHWNLMAWILSTFKIIVLNYFDLKHVTNNVCIFVVAKIVVKTSFSCKCYTDGQRMKLTVYIIHGPFGDMLSYNLWFVVGCNFTYATKTILVVNVDYNYFIVTNWHFSSNVSNNFSS